MKHSAVLNSDTVELKIVGKISGEEAAGLGEEVKKLVSSLKNKGLTIKILANYSHAGKHNNHQHNLLEALTGSDFHKIAAFNLDRVPAQIITDLIKLKGLQDEFKLFRTRDEAESWLSE